ncbi:MAG: radical SAM protein [Nanoarchaeota archaeon]|nr:radical SAM protein [Nanoarchaeota archaeon]
MKIESKNKPLVDLRQNGKYLEWVIQEFEGFLGILAGENPNPLQVEIHPYHWSQKLPCSNNCIYCTGQTYRESFKNGNIRGIKQKSLIKLIRDVKGKVKRILLSGNNTEPLLYPYIPKVLDEILKNNLNFFLYTNFYNGNKEIREILVNGDSNDFVRISLDAGLPNSYNKVHNPLDKNSFNIICKNLEELIKLKENRNSDLNVYIHYLLTKDNSLKNELESIVNWAFNTGVEVFQFSIPQKPLTIELKKEDYSAIMSLKTYERVKDNLLNLKEKMNGKIRLGLFEPLRKQKIKTFNRCFIQQIVAVIGYNGLLYPCTSVAGEKFKHLAYGDINKEDFFDIWNSKNRIDRLNFDLSNCPDCTRFEYSINEELKYVKINK